MWASCNCRETPSPGRCFKPNGTRFGGWLLDTSNNNLGSSADYDGDGADEILATSPWGIGILKVTGSTMNSVMLAPNGTRFGGWLFNSPDDIIGPASTFTGGKQAGLMVSSAWGIGVLQLSGGTLTAPAMQPNGTRFGGWLLDTSNNRFGEAASYGGQPATGLLVTSPWGIGMRATSCARGFVALRAQRKRAPSLQVADRAFEEKCTSSAGSRQNKHYREHV